MGIVIVTVVVIVAFEDFFEDAVQIVQHVRVGAFKDVGFRRCLERCWPFV